MVLNMQKWLLQDLSYICPIKSGHENRIGGLLADKELKFGTLVIWSKLLNPNGQGEE